MARDLGVGLGDGVLAGRDALELLGPGQPVLGGLEPVGLAERQLDLGVGDLAVLVQPLAVGGLDLEGDGALGDLLLGDVAAEGLGDLQVAGLVKGLAIPCVLDGNSAGNYTFIILVRRVIARNRHFFNIVCEKVVFAVHLTRSGQVLVLSFPFFCSGNSKSRIVVRILRCLWNRNYWLMLNRILLISFRAKGANVALNSIEVRNFERVLVCRRIIERNGLGARIVITSIRPHPKGGRSLFACEYYGVANLDLNGFTLIWVVLT